MALAALTGALAVAQEPVSFRRDVAPILIARCSACHGPKRAESGWSVETFARLMTPGDSDAPPIVGGDPDASELVALIEDGDARTRMPQEDAPLAPAAIATIRAWVAQGAHFDGPAVDARLTAMLLPRAHPAAPTHYRAPVLALAFAPDGATLAVGGHHEVLLRDARDGALTTRLGNMPQRVHALAFAPDGATLAIAGGTPGEYGELRLVARAGNDARVPLVVADLVTAVAFTADGSTVACGCADGSVHVVDVATGTARWSTRLHADAVTAVALDDAHQFVASGSRDHTVKVFALADGTLFTSYTRHTQTLPSKPMFQNAVFAVAFAPGSPLAVSAGEAGRVHLWDPIVYQREDGTAAQMEERFQAPDHVRIVEEGRHDVTALAVTADAIWTAASDGRVRRIGRVEPAVTQVLDAGGDWLYAVAASDASGLVAAAGFDGTLRVWSLADGAPRYAIAAQPQQ